VAFFKVEVGPMSAPHAADTMLDWALAYARADYNLFPVHTMRSGKCSCGGAKGCKPAKHPVGTLVPHGLNDATTDLQKIKEWWTKMPDANIGIRTGKASDLVVLDVDGIKGEKTLADGRPLPRTVVVQTGNGRHYHFGYPKNIAKIKSVAREEIGLDVRADGGYVVVPPSVHENACQYQYLEGGPEALAECPDWLVAYANDEKYSSPITPRDIDRPKLASALDNATPATQYSEAEEARLLSALAYIPAHDRRVWLIVLMAIHGLGWGEKGFQIGDDWSRTCPAKYNETDQRKTWESFDRPYSGKPITVATIYALAKKYGSNSTPNGEPSPELTQREKLISIGLEAELWHDKEGNMFATVKASEHAENFSIKNT
jgi:hypothetical protein